LLAIMVRFEDSVRQVSKIQTFFGAFIENFL
jgi:hypothetical protein